MRGEPARTIAGAIRDSGLTSGDDRGVVMVSGGADSVALLLGLVEVLGANRLVVLHVNYGLRAAARDEEELVRALSRDLGVDLEVHRAGSPDGNVQAWAREIRHREAERVRSGRGLDWIAVGHNRSDLAETFLYRLVSSPGTRSLLAMPPRSGNLIRPLLALDRQQIRAMLPDYIESAEDESNRDPSYARNRIRLEVIPALEKVNPAAELNISRSRAELQEDEDALAGIAADALARAGGPGPDGVPGRLLEGNPPAVQRRLLRLLAEAELGRPVSIGSSMATEAARLARNPEGGRLDLGQGGFLLLEAGRIKVVDSEEPAVEPEPVPITAAKETIGFEGWEIASSRITEDQSRAGFGDPLKAFFGADFAGLKLRRWHFGDRIEPLGMSGSKRLQDVFTDRRVPASRRRRWPVLTAGETVVWLPGLVRSRHLLVGESGRPVLRLHARPPFAI